VPDASHLSEHELAGLLDDDLEPLERERVVAHLDRCASCRRELVEMQQVVDASTAPRPEQSVGGGALLGSTTERARRPWRVAASIGALAAAAAVALLVTDRATSDDTGGPRVRDAAVAVDEGRQRIAVVTPHESATVSARSAVFSWRPTSADLYRFTLLTESGERVWTHETADTTLQLPARVAPTQETAYFWRVDAIADGIAATTGSRVVRVTR
jgi:Putative zinc-finger